MYLFAVIALLLSPLYPVECGLVDYVLKQTTLGIIRGHTQEIFPRRPVDIFLGVPYAKPPIEDLRFEPPVATEKWESILNATEMPPACPQTKSNMLYINAHVPNFNNTNEDCLYLNIYAPYLSPESDPMPVLVYIHGGSNEVGMGGMFHGTVLSSYTDIVVVTVNYRLGPLGFLSMGNKDFPGNYGLLDQIAALKWVRDNIHSFGGDPARVTLGGHSSGSCDVSLHLLSPLAKGLFRAVIAQSGSPSAAWAILRPPQTPETYSVQMAADLGCDDQDQAKLKVCLRAIPVDDIINAQIQRPPTLFTYYPVIDGHYISDLPEHLMTTGNLNSNIYFTGVTKNEGSLYSQAVVDHYGSGNYRPDFFRNVLQENLSNFPNISGILDLMMYEYTNWSNLSDSNTTLQLFSELLGDLSYVAPMIKTAEILSKRNVSVYTYRFEHRSKYHPQPDWIGVPHGDELFYIFGSPLIGHKLYNYTDEDKKVSEMMMTIWGNFVRHGVPGTYVSPTETHKKFQAYKHPSKFYAKLRSDRGTAKTGTGSNMRARKMAFWNELLPKLKVVTRAYTASFLSSALVGLNWEILTWILVSVTGGLMVLLLIVTLYIMRLKSQLTKASDSSTYSVSP